MKNPESLKIINRNSQKLVQLNTFLMKYRSMKNVIFVFIFSACLAACERPNTTLESANNGGLDLTKYELTPIPGTDVQRAVRIGENGRIKELGLIRNGMREGAWATYFDDKDIPQMVANFVKDKYCGLYTEYSRQGQIILLCNYANNRLEGRIARFRLGRTTEEGGYRNGKLDGNYKKYYESKSIVQQEANYTAGELDGKTLFFNEKGDTIVEYTYKMGQKIEGGIVEKSGE